MAQGTWVNIAGTWKKVTNVWQNVGGVWKQKVIPKGNIVGVWKAFMQYLLLLYENGVEYFTFIMYDSFGSGYSFSKLSDRIRLTAYRDESGKNGRIGLKTSTMIDITSFSKLYIDWQQTSVGAGTQTATLTVLDATNTEIASFSNGGTATSRRTDSIDISSLSGNYYIGFKYFNNQVDSGNLYVFKVWLE